MARNLPAHRSHFGDVCGTRYHLMRERYSEKILLVSIGQIGSAKKL